MSLLPPPEADYDTFNQLLAEANMFAKVQSYTITVQRTLKSKRSTGDFYKAFLICDRGGEYQTVATKRFTSSRKVGCDWSAVATYYKNLGRWCL